jgi:hypothetical protein
VKFIADSNVGKLARWLRILGYDTYFERSIDDERLLQMAQASERIILSRDRELMKRKIIREGKVQAIFIQDDAPCSQISQVIGELNLDARAAFSRCLECNDVLVPRSKEEVRCQVPPYVFLTQDKYMECPSCHRFYWRGTHWQRMNTGLTAVCSSPKP